MADKNSDKAKRLERRKWNVRSGLFGTTERPRLSVYRSSKHMYVQIIDDYAGKTLVSVATTSGDVRGDQKTGANVAAAKKAGLAIAQRAKQAGITRVAFDRGGRQYHGRV